MIILIMNKLKSKINKKVLFKMKVFQLSRVKLTNCVDKNILRSAWLEMIAQLCVLEKKKSVAERK